MDGNGCFCSITQRARIVSAVESISVGNVQPTHSTARVEVGFDAVVGREKNSVKNASLQVKGQLSHGSEEIYAAEKGSSLLLIVGHKVHA
jgi:hypothetical protein